MAAVADDAARSPIIFFCDHTTVVFVVIVVWRHRSK
jgi:hypothetical protein